MGLSFHRCLWATAVVCALWSSGCRCGEGQVVAQVISLSRVTETSHGSGAWSPAAPNDELRVGDALRTDNTGHATVEVFGQGEIRVASNSIVRFADYTAQGSGELRLVFETGTLDVTTAPEEDAPLLIIDGPQGRLRLDRGTQARIVLDEAQRVNLSVHVGRAELERAGERTTLPAGSSLSVDVRDAGALTIDLTSDGGADAEAGLDGSASDGDGGDGGLAEGVELRLGRKARLEIRAPGEDTFHRVKGRRLTLAPGTAVRVTGDAPVEIPGPNGSSVELRPRAEAVISGSRGNRFAVRLNKGTAEARGTASGLVALTVPGGSAETTALGGGGRFGASTMGGGRTRVNVRGGATVIRSGNRTTEATTGTEVIIGPGGSMDVSARADVQPVLRSGSGVVYDPQAVGALTIRFQPIDGCSTYVVQVTHSGERHVNAVVSRPSLPLTDLRYGAYRWRAACVRDGTADWSTTREGQVVRRADRSGHTKLPTSAPRNSLDSDGRRYTVLYQNRLPELNLRWSKAPEAAAYTLEVFDDGSGRRVHKGRHKRASRGFKSGFFREGSYYWFFRAEGAAKKAASPMTRVRVAFDNVMPAIQILEPREGAAASGSVRVRGVVAVGSTVQVNGVSLDLGNDYRFDQQVPVGPGGIVIFVVSTPRRGVGYYLRHLGG